MSHEMFKYQVQLAASRSTKAYHDYLKMECEQTLSAWRSADAEAHRTILALAEFEEQL